MLGMHTVQLFSSYRNQDTMCWRCQQGLLREPGCCAGTVGLVSGGVMQCLVCLLYIISVLLLYYIYLYKYMACLISCIMIDGHEIK
jgi:hypothetical protein